MNYRHTLYAPVHSNDGHVSYDQRLFDALDRNALDYTVTRATGVWQGQRERVNVVTVIDDQWATTGRLRSIGRNVMPDQEVVMATREIVDEILLDSQPWDPSTGLPIKAQGL